MLNKFMLPKNFGLHSSLLSPYPIPKHIIVPSSLLVPSLLDHTDTSYPVMSTPTFTPSLTLASVLTPFHL